MGSAFRIIGRFDRRQTARLLVDARSAFTSNTSTLPVIFRPPTSIHFCPLLNVPTLALPTDKPLLHVKCLHRHQTQRVSFSKPLRPQVSFAQLPSISMSLCYPCPSRSTCYCWQCLSRQRAGRVPLICDALPTIMDRRPRISGDR